MYRLINSLLLRDNSTLPAGIIADLEGEYKIKPSTIEILIKNGAIAKVSTPPLEVLPGWAYRAKRLASKGVETVEDLLKSDTEALAGELGLKPETVETYKTEARESLFA